jgi:GTP-binding protein
MSTEQATPPPRPSPASGGGRSETADDTEIGRRLFAAEWRFTHASGAVASLPAMAGIEIAFAGRSNVGKSSLINALTGRNGLARTSNTPGRTQELVFFCAGGRLTLVDMPGYGFAAAAKSKIAAWTDLIQAYLRGRANLARVYVLVDARHGLKEVDHGVFKSLDEAATSYQVVLTKADQVKAGALAGVVAATQDGLRKHPAAYPQVIATSSRDGAGVAELRAAVARLLAEKGG